MQDRISKKILLTGDRPTGALHLGHYLGSIKNRIKLQDEYDSYFIIADLQVLTDHVEKAPDIKNNVKELMKDYLALGLRDTNFFFIQSQVPALSELTMYLGFLTSDKRARHNPTLKNEIKMYGNKYVSAAMMQYPLSQAADILGFNASVVPVGKDQLPHLELTCDVARKFNQHFSSDIFTIPEAIISECPSLIGTDGQNKMSKSLNNAIFFSMTDEEIAKRVNFMYTDPNRMYPTDPGKVEGNVVFTYHDYFNPNKEEVEDLKERYRTGRVGDKECKDKLTKCLIEFITPIREARMNVKESDIQEILYFGNKMANITVNETVERVKDAFSLTWPKKDIQIYTGFIPE